MSFGTYSEPIGRFWGGRPSALQAAALAGADERHELLVAQVQERVQVNSAERELFESALLFHGHIGDLFCFCHARLFIEEGRKEKRRKVKKGVV